MTADGTLTVNQGLFKGSIDVGNGQFTVDSTGKVVAKSIEVGTSSSRATLYGSTVLATNFSCNSSFNVDCYANMADIGGNTISCGTLRANHIYGSIDDFSDRRLKQNIHPVDAETAIRIIKQLKPVSYSMKRYDREGVGFIAQDVQKICLKQGIDLPLYGRPGKVSDYPVHQLRSSPGGGGAEPAERNRQAETPDRIGDTCINYRKSSAGRCSIFLNILP